MVSLCTPDAFAVSAGAWSMDKSVHVLYLCSRVFCVRKYTAFCIAGRGILPQAAFCADLAEGTRTP